MSKIKGWLLPAVVNPDRVCITLSIPDDQRHIAAFWGALQNLAEWWNWERDDLHTATEVAQVWRNVLTTSHQANYDNPNEACLMLRQNPTDPCKLERSDDGGGTWVEFADLQLCPPLIRIGDNGQVQISDDGGETWQDVIVQTPHAVPPAAGQEDKCLAARNAAEVYMLTWEQAFAAWQSGGNIMIGISAFIAILATAIFIPIAVPAVWTFFLALWDIAQILTGGEWTGTVTDELTECFYCNMTISGGIASLDWAGVQTCINDHDPGSDVIWAVIQYISNIVGQEGTEQAAATRSITTYDCHSYPCAETRIIVASDQTGFFDITDTVTVEQLTDVRWRCTGHVYSLNPTINVTHGGWMDVDHRAFTMTNIVITHYNPGSLIQYRYDGTTWQNGWATGAYGYYMQTDGVPTGDMFVIEFDVEAA